MDLNVAPSADDDDDERQESAVNTMRREREERKLRLKRQREDERVEAKSHKISRPSISIPREKMNVGPLPEGWLDCPSMGEAVGLFVPSKVPLGERFNEVIPPGKRFSRSHVTRHQRAVSREIAMVIDLTNTSRYYSPMEWTKGGVKHVKVRCRGRDEVPEPEAVNQFVYEVLKFQHSTQGKGPNKYVLVHCTHGHNRTGFMIVHYLMRTQLQSVEQAIQIFADARPPGIYKQDYIENLYTFYNERRPDGLICPGTPDWKKPLGVDLNGAVRNDDGDDDDDDDGGILAALQEDARDNSGKITNDDVLGDAIPDEQQSEMQRLCCQFLGVPIAQHMPLRFPGSQPVSLDRKNLQLLKQRYYYATWKADGTRYMMFITRDGSYLIDRNFRFRRVQLRFPVKVYHHLDYEAQNHKEKGLELQHITLLDGEMVIDTVPDPKNSENKIQSRRYLVYDLMVLNQRVLAQLPFHDRWKMIKDDVILPRQAEKSRAGRYVYDMEKFSIRRKDFWILSTTQKLLCDFIPTKLPHEADGLILQGWDDFYVPRTHEGLLKWKYAHMNSVDFLLQVSPSNQCLLFLMERGKSKQLEGAQVTFPDSQDPKSMEGKVIECSWKPDEGVWEFMRIRYDKDTPNAWHVYEKVMSSINDNITEEVLLSEIEEIIRLPQYEERMLITQREQQQPHRR